MKCKLIGIDGRKVEPIEFELDALPNHSAGGAIFAQQSKIPHYRPDCFYAIEHEGIKYDIDRIGWALIDEVH